MLQLLRKVVSLIDQRDRPKAMLHLGLLCIGACLEAVGIGLIMPFIAVINDASVLQGDGPLSMLYKYLGEPSTTQFVITFGALLLLFYIGKNVFLGCHAYYQNRFIYGQMALLSHRLLVGYLRAPYAFHIEHNSAELQRTINIDMPLSFEWVVAQSFIVIADLLVVAVIVTLLMLIEPVATVCAAAVVAGVGAAFFRWVANRSGKTGLVEQQSKGQMIKWVNQALGSVKETKVLGKDKYFSDRFLDNVEDYTHARRFVQTINEFPRLFLEATAVSAVLIIAIVIMSRKAGSEAVLPAMALFAAAAFRLIPATSRIIRSSNLIRHFIPALDAVTKHLTLGRIEACTDGAVGGGEQRDELCFTRQIELRNVGFRYAGNVDPIVDGVSLTISKGQSVAFVGPSGAGKTTIVDLVTGLLEPSSGEILVDGSNISRNVGQWQSNIGYIPQSIYLTDDSLRRNVAFGVADDDIVDDRVWQALKSAQLDGFVNALPAGLESNIGENGIRLSGGQRQRLGVARALYHDPDVLIMDEATSALDAETETAVADAINQLGGAKTLLIVAHRLSTVKNCDILFLLKRGRLAEQGTYAELAGRSFDFRRIAGVDSR